MKSPIRPTFLWTIACGVVGCTAFLAGNFTHDRFHFPFDNRSSLEKRAEEFRAMPQKKQHAALILMDALAAQEDNHRQLQDARDVARETREKEIYEEDRRMRATHRWSQTDETKPKRIEAMKADTAFMNWLVENPDFESGNSADLLALHEAWTAGAEKSAHHGSE